MKIQRDKDLFCHLKTFVLAERPPAAKSESEKQNTQANQRTEIEQNIIADWGQKRGQKTQEKPRERSTVNLCLCVSSLGRAFLWATGSTAVYET